MSHRIWRSWVFCTLAGLGLWSQPAQAVLIKGGDGSGNTTAPGIDPGWGYVGTVGGSSGIYVGNGWVLTAAHVGAGPITLNYNHQTYSASGVTVRLVNRDNDPSTTDYNSDLMMYRLSNWQNLAGLAPLTLPTVAAAVNQGLTMIGNGANRQGSLLTWKVNTATNPWTWTPDSTGNANAAGYSYNASSHTMRWGTNTVTSANVPGGDLYIVSGTLNGKSGLYTRNNLTDFTSISYYTRVFSTNFSSDGSDSECQVVPGDSGGAAFSTLAGESELAGVIVSMAGYPNQPASTSVYWNSSYMADLSFYHDQIYNLVPEPASLTVLGIGAMALVRRRRRS